LEHKQWARTTENGDLAKTGEGKGEKGRATRAG
jgi:hypothetical protein